MSRRKIIVVGAGAAGLLAAGIAADSGAEVHLLEKMERPGRKLLLTGKGRCNLTNRAPLEEFIEHFGRNGRFLRTAFGQFFSGELIALLGKLGVRTVDERGGRVFPADNDAASVAEALRDWLGGTGVRMRFRTPVSALSIRGDAIDGVFVGPSRKFEPAEAVIVATGGASYPATGSTGDAYAWAAEAGHTIVPVRPALVPLVTAGDTAKKLQGLSLKNVTATLWIGGKKRASLFGEMLFAHFGLTGPIILSLSREAVDALRDAKPVEVAIDLKPALDEAKLDARLRRDFDTHGKRHFQTLLEDLLPKKMIPVGIAQVKIPAAKEASQITGGERKRLLHWLKDFRLRVVGHRGYAEAIVTAGGVDLRRIDPRTMQSRLVRGLYFAGEVLDLDGDTGGYNLQAAFSTGWLAGRSAASACPNKAATP